MRVKDLLITNSIYKLNSTKNRFTTYLFGDFLDLKKFSERDRSRTIHTTRWSLDKFRGKNNINKFYNICLNQLRKDLNQYHKISYSKNFWEMVLGPWCITYIDKYLKNYFAIKEIYGDKVFLYGFINHKKNIFIPFDNKEFIIFSSSDIWQNYITKIVIEDNFKKQSKLEKINFKIKFDYKTMNELYSNVFFTKINQFFLRFSKILILNIPSTKIQLLKILFKIKQFGKIKFENHLHKKYISRKTFINNYKKNNSKLIDVLYNRLISDVPTMALENFDYLVNFIEKKYKKINPQKILFTTGHIGVTELLFFCALKKEKGCKLIINQHGGRYNMIKYHWFESFEKKISDTFLTWGHNLKKHLKISFGGIPQQRIRRLNNSNKLLIALSSHNTYEMYSENRNARASKYFFINLNKYIFNNLNKNIYKNLVFRFQNLRNYNLKYFYKENLSKIKIDQHPSLKNSLKDTKLVITNFTSTIALETLSMNVPTILVNDIDYNQYNSATRKVIKKLKKNKILFDNFEQASIFLNNNWNKIDEWWVSKKIQNQIKFFLRKYCFSNKNYSNNLINILNTI